MKSKFSFYRYSLLSCIFFLLSHYVLAEMPKWINNVASSCSKAELCAVGIGPSLSMAKINATAGISKIFNTEIKSKFETEVSFNGAREEISGSEKIEEITGMALSGVEHPFSHFDDHQFYAFAKVKKSQLRRVFRKEMEQLENQIKVKLQNLKTGAIFQVERLYWDWNELSKRYLFLTGIEQLPPITLMEIHRIKKKLSEKIKIHLYIDEKSPKALTSYIEKAMGQMGYRLMSGKVLSSDASHLLLGNLAWSKLHFKVKGFEKYKFIFTLDAQNRKREKSSGIQLDFDVTGRNFDQAYEKVLKLIKSDILKQLESLSFVP